MHDSTPDLETPWGSVSATATAAAEPSPDRRRPTVSIDSVPVDPAVFEDVVYRGFEPKYESQSDVDYRANRPKQQKVNKEGVPVWSLKLAAVMRPSGNYREREGDIKVSWASHQEPTAVFDRYRPVELVNLRFGVTGTKRRDGTDSYAVYWTAEDVRPVSIGKASAA